MTDMDTFNGERPQWLRLMGRLKSASMSCLRNGFDLKIDSNLK